MKNDLSVRYFRQGISGRAGIQFSNLSIQCNHQMVTFRACAVNLYQATRSKRGVAWGRGYYGIGKVLVFMSVVASRHLMNQPYMYIYHNFLFSGWVQTVEYHDLGPDFTSCLLNAKVKPSQRLSDKPHEPWVATWKKKSGMIITAHCLCMAG